MDEIRQTSNSENEESRKLKGLYKGVNVSVKTLNIVIIACVLLIIVLVAMDLRDLTSEEVTATLPHIRYVYVRYSLRLLTDRQTPAATEDALSHGFERIFEMDPSVEKNDTETAAP